MFISYLSFFLASVLGMNLKSFSPQRPGLGYQCGAPKRTPGVAHLYSDLGLRQGLCKIAPVIVEPQFALELTPRGAMGNCLKATFHFLKPWF